MRINSIICPSCEFTFESKLSLEEFTNRLLSETESPEESLLDRFAKRFGGHVSRDGNIEMTYGMYGRGIRLSGIITTANNGSVVRLVVGLPGWYLTFGLSFTWGIIAMLIAAIIMVMFPMPHISFLAIIKALVVISIPLLLGYGIMFSNVWQGSMRIQQFFEDNLKGHCKAESKGTGTF